MLSCVKRDVKKTGEEEECKKKTRDRGGWKTVSDVAVKKLQAAPHPRQWGKEEEREVLLTHIMLNGNRRRASWFYFCYIFCSEDIQIIQQPIDV